MTVEPVSFNVKVIKRKRKEREGRKEGERKQKDNQGKKRKIIEGNRGKKHQQKVS